MNFSQKLLIAIMMITAFVFLVSFGTLYVQTHIMEGTVCSCTLPIPLLIPTFSSFGVFVGALTYYFLSPRIEVEKSKLIKLLDTFIRFFPPDESFVLRKIIQNGGEILQSKISSEMGKVKCFRAIESLRKKGLIEKEPYGKTNKLLLNEDLLTILK